uniref:RRM domain-containing protein n=1 Tax=Fagus sylvatica TaxID=28930 RepID=A0A2N9H3K2_FAGSY
MAEDVVAPALGTAAMEAVVEIFLQVFWFGIFASTAGQKICVGHLGSLASSRTFTSLEIIILVLKTPMKYCVEANNEVIRGVETPIKEPRGFGFVQYVDPADAADAKYHMDGDACFQLMALRLRACRIRSVYDQRRSLLRYSRSPRYARTHSRSPDYYSPSPRWRHYSRSISLETECIGSGHTQDRLMGQGVKAGAGALDYSG